MLSKEENDALTLVGAGTPAGDLLRRYWHPVAVAGELTAEQPTKRVTILGEQLVVYRLPPKPGESEARYGLTAEGCRHRMASLALGIVDCEGIRCIYHGWKYAPDGRCIEQPAEPPNSTYKNRIHQPSYPVRKLAGLLFAYMGPLPEPILPRWDVLARSDGRRWIEIESVIDCNWLQPVENSVDPAHVFWLHGTLTPKDLLAVAAPQIMSKYDETHEFVEFKYGIIKRRITPGNAPKDAPFVAEHPLIFPTTLRLVEVDYGHEESPGNFRHSLQIRVPLDDRRTLVYRVYFVPSMVHQSPPEVDPPFRQCPLKTEAGYDMNILTAQDAMAWESQGAITDRTQEHLGHSDRGIVMFRRLLSNQTDLVRQGADPMCVFRDESEERVIGFEVFNERIGLLRGAAKEAYE